MSLSNNRRQKLTPEQPGPSMLRGERGFAEGAAKRSTDINIRTWRFPSPSVLPGRAPPVQNPFVSLLSSKTSVRAARLTRQTVSS